MNTPTDTGHTTAAESAKKAHAGTKNPARFHYSQLDGLRGYAILMVMIYHFGLDHRAISSPGFLLDLSQLGWMGVDLFFVLSGFLITGILLETKCSPNYIRNFLARRFLRIWPLYYACLLLFFVVVPLVTDNIPGALRSMQEEQMWFWAYAANWLFAIQGGFNQTSGGYFWSLAVEEQFYLIWPFVVLRLSNSALMKLSVLILCGSLIARIVALTAGLSPSTVYVMTITHVDGLAVGAFLAVALRYDNWSSMIYRIAPYVIVVSVIGLLAIRIVGGSWYFWTPSMAYFGYTLAALTFGGVLALALRSELKYPWSFIVENKVMLITGKYSYALYLIHVPVATALALIFSKYGLWNISIGYTAAFLIFLALAFSISYFLAFLSWHLFEKRILQLKRYFDYK